MNKVLNTTAAIVTLAALAPGLAMANSIEKRVIAIKTNDFELSETDVSDLAVGEAETIVTEDGKTVDILRTAEGLEIYVDGELLDMSFGESHGTHRMHKRKVITCDGAEGDCLRPDRRPFPRLRVHGHASPGFRDRGPRTPCGPGDRPTRDLDERNLRGSDRH